MPRRDDIYYRRRPALLLTSEIRFTLTRAQWGIYNDLLDLLYVNGGSVSDNRAYLAHQLIADKDDLEAVLAIHHIRIEGGKIRHNVVDNELAELDSMRQWGSELGKRSAASRAKRTKKQRTVERTVEQNVEPESQRTVGHPQLVTKLTEGRSATPQSVGNGTPPGGGGPAAADVDFPRNAREIRSWHDYQEQARADHKPDPTYADWRAHLARAEARR